MTQQPLSERTLEFIAKCSLTGCYRQEYKEVFYCPLQKYFVHWDKTSCEFMRIPPVAIKKGNRLLFFYGCGFRKDDEVRT